MNIGKRVEINYETHRIIGTIKKVYCKSYLVEFIENDTKKEFIFPKKNIRILDEIN